MVNKKLNQNFSTKKLKLITIIQNTQEIAKECNNFFASVGQTLVGKIHDTEKSFQDFLTAHNEKIQFEELNFDEFEEAFKSLKRNKAAAFDDLRSNIIINAHHSLKNIIFHVFKVSFKQGIFPDSLKIAKVTPIFKSGAKDNVSIYRPLSILPVFSKVLERIKYNKVYNHLNSKAFFMKNSLAFK